MRTCLQLITLLCLAFCSAANAQQPQATESPVLVYHNDDSVKPPRLLSTDFSSLVADNCKGEASAIVVLDLVVDASGKPQNIDALHSFDDNLERMAVAIAKVDRFESGIKDRTPVAVATELHISLSICTVKVQDENGKSSARLRLKSKPMQTLFPTLKAPPSTVSFSPDGQFKQPDSPGLSNVGGGVSAPVPTETPIARQTDHSVQGVCVISLIVDEHGLPTNLRLVRGLTESADQAALDAVSHYRFKPAMKGKQPVAVRMTIEVSFRNY
jgi:TonB family protein